MRGQRRDMRAVGVLDRAGLLRLLRREIKAAGNTALWAKKFGINRWAVYHILRGQRSPSRSVIKALGLEIVYRRRKQ